MAEIIDLTTYTDERWRLTVVTNDQSVVPFDIKRQFRVYDVNYKERGAHRHHITQQLLICLHGSCEVHNNDGHKREIFNLNTPSKGLLVQPTDFHTMTNFTKDAILMVFASHPYNKDDYIYDDYSNE